MRKERNTGFTLLELLVVLVIIGLLAGYVGPRYFSQVGKSEVKVAQAQMDAFDKALVQFRLDIGRFPTTEEGLDALVKKPVNEPKWNGPYLSKAVPERSLEPSLPLPQPGRERRLRPRHARQGRQARRHRRRRRPHEPLSGQVRQLQSAGWRREAAAPIAAARTKHHRETLMRHSIRRLLPAAVMGLAAVAVAPSYAQSGGSQARGGPWMGGTMDTNFYIGANVGQSRFKDSCDNVPVSCDDKDLAWKAYAGYQFHRNIAVEAGYFNLGSANASGVVGGVAASAEAKVRGWEVLGVASFPVMNQLALYGKLGVAFSRVKVSGTAAGGGFGFATSTTDNSTDLTYGVGAEYSFARNIAARVEWQRYDSVGGDSTGKDDIDLFSLGVLFKF